MSFPRFTKHAGLLSVLLLLAIGGTAFAQDATLVRAEQGNGLLWVFRVFAVLMLATAALTISVRNAVVAALCLVGTLISTGVLFLLLHASFLAAIQVLVYAGAIMVLFVFVVMSVGDADEHEIGISSGLISKILGLAALIGVLFVVLPQFKSQIVPQAAPLADTSDFGSLKPIGRLLFSDYLFPFEVLSVLLLVAIVGAVMVSRRRSADETVDQGGAQ